MPKLLAVEFTSDTASLELFDKESLRLKQVTGIDIQDMKDDMLRHHLIMHAREQAGHVLQGQRGAGRRQSQRGCRRCSVHTDRCSEDQGNWSEEGELMQADKERDDAK